MRMAGIPSTGSGRSFYFSSRPNPLGILPSSRDSNDIDKLAHIGEYAGLAVLLHRALSNSRGGDKEEGRQGEGMTKRSSPPPLVTLSAVCSGPRPFRRVPSGTQSWPEVRIGRHFDKLNTSIVYDLAGTIAALGLIWLRERGKANRRGGSRGH